MGGRWGWGWSIHSGTCSLHAGTNLGGMCSPQVDRQHSNLGSMWRRWVGWGRRHRSLHDSNMQSLANKPFS